MSQINLLASVISGNQLVQFPVNTDLSFVVEGDIFSVITDNVTYNIGTINDAFDQITLTGNYLGDTNSTANSLIHNSNTSPDLISYPEAGDIKNISVIKQGFLKVQELFTSVKNNILTIESDQNTDQTNITNLQIDTTFIKDRFLVAEINQVLTSSAIVDTLIYDTTQDSDLGNWRFLKKSWYSESTPSGIFVGRFVDEAAARAGGGLENDWYARTGTTDFYKLNASTETQIYRAGRKEFPKISLITAETDRVIIFDLTTNEPSMWMVIDLTGKTINAVACGEGVLLVATTTGLFEFNFARDILPTSETYTTGTTLDIVNNVCNDVVLTILDDAPIDSVTGLKVSTRIVSTASGVSFISHDGNVYDSTHADSLSDISIVDGALYSSRSDTFSRFGISDQLSTINADGWSSLLHNLYSASVPPIKEGSSGGVIGHKALGLDIGLQILERDFDDITQSMSALITKDFSTGWMVGDIRGCLLADSNVGSIVGTELVTNGTFDTTITGFTSPDSSTASWDASQRFKSTATSNALGIQYTLTGLIAGETYVVSLSVEPLAGTDTNFLSVRIDDVVKGVVLETSHAVETTHGRTFIATATSHVLKVNGTSGSVTVGETCMFDNISCRLAVEDRSVKANGAQVFGTVTKSLIDTNSEFVAYSGFSASNYLEQPYNSDLDFGTSDFHFGMWLKQNSNTVGENIFTRAFFDGTWFGSLIVFSILSDGRLISYVSDDAFVSSDAVTTTNTIDDGRYHFVEFFREGNYFYICVDGTQWGATLVSNAAGSLSNTSAKLNIGLETGTSNPLTNGSLALFRVSATLPTAEQRKHIYETERQMIVNKCLLDGDSNAVTALNFNGKRNLLSVGTNWGRTDLNNLVRVDSEVTSVGVLTAIAYDGDLILNGGASGSDILIPEIDLRAELLGQDLKTVEDNEWQDLVLENSWLNYGATVPTAKFRKIGDIVYLSGLIKSGVTTTNTTFLTLPVGFRPTLQVQFVTTSNNAFGSGYIENDGKMKISVADSVWFNLDGISFSVS